MNTDTIWGLDRELVFDLIWKKIRRWIAMKGEPHSGFDREDLFQESILYILGGKVEVERSEGERVNYLKRAVISALLDIYTRGYVKRQYEQSLEDFVGDEENSFTLQDMLAEEDKGIRALEEDEEEVYKEFYVLLSESTPLVEAWVKLRLEGEEGFRDFCRVKMLERRKKDLLIGGKGKKGCRYCGKSGTERSLENTLIAQAEYLGMSVDTLRSGVRKFRKEFEEVFGV